VLDANGEAWMPRGKRARDGVCDKFKRSGQHLRNPGEVERRALTRSIDAHRMLVANAETHPPGATARAQKNPPAKA